MKIIYATFAIIAITILSIFTFKEDLIYYNYAKYTLKNEINPKEFYCSLQLFLLIKLF